MDVISDPAAMTAWSKKRRAAGKTIALVPTMGCFHAGHLSLMREAGRLADLVAVSLFVNPSQFGPNEDYAQYPRPFADDREAAEKAAVDVLFAPAAEAVYPPGFQTTIKVGRLSRGLCGAARPGHFDGVATVVAKLFNIVRPDLAVFGEKDFQQLAIIRALARDLNFDLKIVGHPIVREADGLAMSSRNRYLSGPERESALCLSQALQEARREVRRGQGNCRKILARLHESMAADSLVKIDYLKIIDDISLEEQDEVSGTSILVMAVKIGRTRLIDNGYLVSDQ